MRFRPLLLLLLVPVLAAAGTILVPPGARVQAKSLLPRNERPFTLAGVTWPSKRAFVAAGGRCGTREPGAAQTRRTELALAQLAAPGAKAAAFALRGPGTVPIQVYVHVITAEDGFGDVTDDQIRDQIAVLNRAYAGQDAPGAPGQGPGQTPSANTPFRFVLAGIDRTAEDAWHRMEKGTPEERAAQEALRVGGADALNLYIALPMRGEEPLLGYATPPLDYTFDPVADGVVVAFDTLPGGSAAPFDLGDTAVHEIGHWLGLEHTFRDGCLRTGDGAFDTPAQAFPNFDLPPPYPDTCVGARFKGRDPVENFMDYSDDLVLFQFTPEQSARMDRLVHLYRGL